MCSSPGAWVASQVLSQQPLDSTQLTSCNPWQLQLNLWKILSLLSQVMSHFKKRRSCSQIPLKSSSSPHLQSLSPGTNLSSCCRASEHQFLDHKLFCHDAEAVKKMKGRTKMHKHTWDRGLALEIETQIISSPNRPRVTSQVKFSNVYDLNWHESSRNTFLGDSNQVTTNLSLWNGIAYSQILTT